MSVIAEYEGSTLEFPDGTTQDQIISFLKKNPSIIPKTTRKTGVLEDVGIGLGNVAHSGKTALDMVAGGAARLAGDEAGSDAIYSDMIARQDARKKMMEGLDQGFSGKAISGISGILPMIAAAPIAGPLAAATGMATMSGLDSASENIRGGASTGQALAQFGSEVGTDAIANALPIGKGLLKGAAYGAGGNVASQAAQDLTGSQLIGGEKYDPSVEKYGLQAITGAVPGAVFGRMNKDGKLDMSGPPKEEPLPQADPLTQQAIDAVEITRLTGQLEAVDRALDRAHRKNDELSKTGSMTEKQYEWYQKNELEIEELNKERTEKLAKLQTLSGEPFKSEAESTLENLKNFDTETLEVRKPEPPPMEDGYLDSLGKPVETLPLKDVLGQVFVETRLQGKVQDPTSVDILKSKSFSQLQTTLESLGIEIKGVLGRGSSSVVLDTTRGALRLGIGELANPPKSKHLLEPIERGMVGNLRFELMPKADTNKITADHMETIEKGLESEGLVFSDPGLDNIGLVNGVPKVIDRGAVLTAPKALVNPASLENTPIVVEKPKAKTTQSDPVIKQMTEPKMEAANTVAESLGKPSFDPDLTRLVDAKDLIADPEAKDMDMGVLNKAERAGFGMGQYVEAIKRQAPVVWETYKRLKVALDKEVERKRTWWYGDAAKEEVKGLGMFMKLSHYEQKNTMATLVPSLSYKDKEAIQKFMEQNSLEQRTHSSALKDKKGAGLTQKQQDAVEVIYNYLETIRSTAKFKERKGFIPSIRKGDFAVGLKSSLGDLVHLEFFKSKGQADEWLARNKKAGLKTMDVMDLRTEEGMRMAEAFDVMREVMAKDPDVLAKLDEVQQGIADNAKGPHNKFKEGYTGGLGQSLFKNAEQNADDFFKGIEEYGNQVAAGLRKAEINSKMAEFIDNSDAGAKLKEMFPNQVETSKYLADIALNNQGKYGWAESLDNMKNSFDNLWVSGVQAATPILKATPVIGKKIKFNFAGKERTLGHEIKLDEKMYYPDVPVLDKAAGMMSQLFYIRVLTSRPAFWAGQLLSSPFALRQVLKEGTLAETVMAQGKAWGTIMSGGDMEWKQFIKRAANRTDSLHPQFKNEINEIGFLDSKTNKGLSRLFNAVSGQTPAGMADSASRYMTFATAYHFYKDKGLSDEALFKNVQNMVDNTMVMYGRTYTSPFIQKMGFVGTQLAPLQKYGIAQLENLIGDFRYIGEGKGGLGKIRNMAPAVSTMLTTMIMAGSIGLPLLMEYEALRMAFVGVSKYLGWDDVEEYVPRSVMEMIMGDSRIKDAFVNGMYDTTGMDKQTAENIMTHGVVSAATGFDVGSSLRFNPLVPEDSQHVSILNAFPIIKEAMLQAGNGVLGIKKLTGGDVTEAESRKALMSMQFVAGQNALVDKFRFNADERATVPGGNRFYGQVEQTGKEQVATALGTQTMEKSRANILSKMGEKRDDKIKLQKQKAVDIIRDGIRTGNDAKIERGLELAQKAGMTGKQISTMVKTGMHNEMTPNLERSYTDRKGRVSSQHNKEMYNYLEEFR